MLCRDANLDPALLDVRTLDELRGLGEGVPGFLSDLVSEFLESCENELAEIVDALRLEDLERAWRIAHGLKGACFMVGARRLGEAIVELERAARGNDLSKASVHLPVVRRAHGATRDALLALC